jgi:ABC-2 type transport system ATP-binding protein
VSATIRAHNLSYLQVLKAISLSVDPGEVLAVVGSRGSGKTTLVRILAGQLQASSGSATIAGVDCRSPELRRLIGVAGEGWGFWTRLTVQENLSVVAQLWELAPERVAEVLRTVDLTAAAHRPVERLQPGELARLRLARALLTDPVALLLDEPIGDVDRESASLLHFAISEAAERGKAVLVTTFGHPKTLELASRLAYLEEGRLIEPPPARQEAQGSAQPADGPVRSPMPLRHIAARRGDRILLFAPDDILYAYAHEKAVYIQTVDGPCAVSLTLTELEERLAPEGFFRCHRAYLVNIRYVKELAAWTRDSFSLILKNGQEVPLSKHRAQALKSRLG